MMMIDEEKANPTHTHTHTHADDKGINTYTQLHIDSFKYKHTYKGLTEMIFLTKIN